MNHVISALLSAIWMMLPSQRYLHTCQLESYKQNAYRKWALSHLSAHTAQYYVFLALLCIRITLNVTLSYWLAMGVGSLFGFAAGLLLYLQYRKSAKKKPIVYTPRMWRLQAATLAVQFVALLLCALVEILWPQRAWGLLQLLVLPLLPLWTWIATLLTEPMEHRFQQVFIDEAREKLAAHPDMLKIGITGSYGKTSTKFIVGTILSEAYTVMVTPHSYNTTMGVARAVRENLRGDEQVFVAEMGARQVGDIKELCDIVKPQYAILTSVGKQHLETFGNLETVARAKYELVQGLDTSARGAAFFSDTENCRDLYMRALQEGHDALLYGFGEDESLYVSAHQITVNAKGSRFLVRGRDGGEVWCQTKLLGTHNIMNILGGIALARFLNMQWNAIARGVASIEPIPHRLQLMDSGNGITIIDDSFNANPAGVKAAMEVLAAFEGRHVVITPGLVELGEEQDAQNEQFGKLLAETADVVILVGRKQTQPIARGLFKQEFARENIHIAENFDAAVRVWEQLRRPGDVVLFENDLPDNYTE